MESGLIDKTMTTVTVGIPAYNEEQNVAFLLNDIQRQNKYRWNLKEIVICNDGSTDATEEMVRSVSLKKIRIIQHRERKGQAASVRDIFRNATGDVIILFDADLRLANQFVINNLIREFDKDEQVLLVSGNLKPVQPKTFIERGISSTFKVFYQSKRTLRGGHNIFGCLGGCLGIKNQFAKEIHIPQHIISQDAFLYLSCVARGNRFRFVNNATVYYKQACTLGDYLKQLFRSRPESVHFFLKQYFGDRVKNEFHRPFKFYLTAIFKAFLEDPFPTAFIILVNLLATPFIPILASRYRSSWPVATSTK